METARPAGWLMPLLALALCLLLRLVAGAETADQIQAKLGALQQAHAAGVLTDDEYARKKAELEAKLRALVPPLDAATKKKLEALDAAHQAGVLTDEEYARKKAELTGPAAPVPPLPPPSVGPAPPQPPAPAATKTYRHALGFTFQYPAAWTANATDDGVQLVPPDAKQTPQGPAEVYLVGGEAAQGIAQANDPRVIQYYDGELRKLAPFLQRAGEAEAVQAAAGPGVVLTWTGTNPTGMAVRARAFITLLKGHAIVLVALGEQEQIKAREATLRQMFATFGVGEGEKDPRLPGAWRTEKHFFSGTFSSTTLRTLVLRPDGTAASGGRLLAGMTHKDSTGTDTGRTDADTGGDPGKKGQWGASGGKLHLLWEDGSAETYPYEVSGEPGSRNLLLKPEGGQPQLWQEVR